MASLFANIWSKIRQVPALLWVGIGVVVVLLIAGGLVAFPVQPQAVLSFQKIAAASPLRIAFPEPMQHQSTEEHLVLPQDLAVNSSWQDDILVLQPKQKLTLGKTYIVRVTKEAKKSDGALLGRDLDFTFVVTGAPALTASIPPKDTQHVPNDTTITLVFDRPMIPLASLEDARRKPGTWPVTVEPNVAGDWNWLSTYSVEFRPKSPLLPATDYSVHIPAGIETSTGEHTEQDFSFHFQTERPRVVRAHPDSNYSLAGPGTRLELIFNQDVDPSQLQDMVTLELVAKNGAAAVKPKSASGTAMGSTVPVTLKRGTKEENDHTVADARSIVLFPSQPLAFDSFYRIHVKQGTKGVKGELGSEKEFTTGFSTVGPLMVTGTYQYGSVHLTFTNPVSSGSLVGGVSVSPIPEGWKDVVLNPEPWSDYREVSIYPDLKASTTYTVTVNEKSKDIYGQKLAKPLTFTFTTPAIDPQITIHSKGDFGIFERSKQPVYYVSSVNVSSMHVQVAPLAIDTFLKTQLEKQQMTDYMTNSSTDLSKIPGMQEWTLSTKNVKNMHEQTTLDLQKRMGALKPGLYGMTIDGPEYKDPRTGVPWKSVQFFAVTNLAITLKNSGDHALVWVTDMTTGEPVRGSTVQLHSLRGATIAEGVTNAEGFFETPFDVKELATGQYDWGVPSFYVTAQKGDDLAFVGSSWSDAMQIGDFNGWWNMRGLQSKPREMQSYSYTDRPVYSVGDTVSFRAMARLRDAAGHYALPSGKQARVSVYTPDGTKVYEKTLSFTAFGSVNGSFPLSKDAALGQYELRLELTPDDDTDSAMSSTYFAVAAYRKPEYKVSVTTKADDYFDGDTLQAEVQGAYYFGAPMANAAVQWRAQSTDWFFNRYTDGFYSFALEDSWCWYNCERETNNITEGKGTLDAAGKLAISFPVSLKDKPISQIATIEADITDTNNQIVSNRVSVPVHKAKVYVGIRSEDYVVNPGDKSTFALVTVNPDGTPAPNTTVSVSLSSRVWKTVEKKGVDGEYYFDNTSVDTFVSATTATTNAEGKATVSMTIPTGGDFSVVASVKDSAGHTASAGTSVYAFSSVYINWPHSNTDRVEVKADKPEYKAGDTAKILILSPFQGKGVKALVTVEREQIIWKKIVDVTSSAQAIEIPITEEMIPNSFVSVVLMKPRIGETFDAKGMDTGVPAFKIGYVKLNVETSKKKLSINLTTDKERYLPGEKVHVTIKTTNSEGAPVPAELSLSTVDMSLLALTGYSLPDLVQQFYSERGLGVSTAQMLTYLVERFKPGSKGGGGGDNRDRDRTKFLDSAYWNPAIVTDKNGTAEASFTLPDNLTTWKLIALGSTKANTFGGGEKDILATKHVVLRSVRPRFAVMGDTMTVGAIVGNFLGKSTSFTVTIDGTGFEAEAGRSQTYTIASDGQQKVLFPIKVTGTTALTLKLSAVSADGKDSMVETIPVHLFGVEQSVATAGTTKDTASEVVIPPNKNDASTGSLSLSVAPSIATYLPGGLSFLATYPYGCAEQTTSSFLGSVALSTLQGFDGFAIVNKKTLDNYVSTAVQKLEGFQKPDGGFSYFQESERSDPYLSAYVVEALQLTQKAGYTVDGTMLNRALTYLSNTLRYATSKAASDLTLRSYIVFVLSEGGRGDTNATLALFEKRADLPLFARAHLAMALQKPSPAKAKTLMDELLATAKIDARGAHFEEETADAWSRFLQTNTRTTALVTRALVRIEPTNPLLPNILRSLLSMRVQNHWDTTQSTITSILALTDYLRETKELDARFPVTVTMNGKKVIESTIGKGSPLVRKEVVLALDQMQRGKENSLQFRKSGTEGTLYYDAVLTSYLTSPSIPAMEQGMSIRRTIEPLSGKVTDVHIGDTQVLTLTVTAPEDHGAVAVTSPLPAGFELIDTQFNTTRQLGTEDAHLGEEDVSIEKQSPWWWNPNVFTHTELRDDEVFLFADDLPAGVYKYRVLVRATTPGTFLWRPARVFEMYFPETFGQTSGGTFTVKE